jgi:hypothetical protein
VSVRSLFMRRIPNVKLVHDDDLERYLKSLGIYDAITGRNARCAYCGEIVDMENIVAIVPVRGVPKVVCSKANCVDHLRSL